MWKDMVFSNVKNNMVVLFSLFVSIVFIISLTDADPTSIFELL